MQQVIFLIVVAVLGFVVFRLRSAAAGERKAVMARLADEREARGDYSPTAELFREAGVTVGAGSVAPPFVPTFERLSDLRDEDAAGGAVLVDDEHDLHDVHDLAHGEDDDGDLLAGFGIATLDLSSHDEEAVSTTAESIETESAEIESAEIEAQPVPSGAIDAGADLARLLLDTASLDDEPPVPADPVPLPGSASAPIDAAEGLDDLPAPVGAPVGDLPAPIGAPVADLPAPEAAPSGDLRTLYRGLQMPAGLKPLGPLEPAQATFVTAALPAVVRAALDDEFERLGCTTTWVETDMARTERNGERGLVMVHPNAETARDPEGRLLFAGVAPGSVAVRMIAL